MAGDFRPGIFGRIRPPGHPIDRRARPRTSPLKGPLGPFKGPGDLLKGPRGPFKGPRGPLKGPRGPQTNSKARIPPDCPQGASWRQSGSCGPVLKKGPRGPFKGPRGPFKGPRGPFKGSRGPFKGPRGPFKGPRGPFKGPRGPLKGPRGLTFCRDRGGDSDRGGDPSPRRRFNLLGGCQMGVQQRAV